MPRPIVVVEVLSPGTDLDHHIDKLRQYARLPSLIHYAVFSQDDPRAYLWRRGELGWPSAPTILDGMEAVIAFPEVGATLKMSDIYGRPERRPPAR